MSCPTDSSPSETSIPTLISTVSHSNPSPPSSRAILSCSIHHGNKDYLKQVFADKKFFLKKDKVEIVEAPMLDEMSVKK